MVRRIDGMTDETSRKDIAASSKCPKAEMTSSMLEVECTADVASRMMCV